jgi:hypothetical protein
MKSEAGHSFLSSAEVTNGYRHTFTFLTHGVVLRHRDNFCLCSVTFSFHTLSIAAVLRTWKATTSRL